MRMMRVLMTVVILSLTIFGASCGKSAPPTPLTVTEYVEWHSSVMDSMIAADTAVEAKSEQAAQLAMNLDPSFWQVLEDGYVTHAEEYKLIRNEWNDTTPPPVFAEYHNCQSYVIDETIRADEMMIRGAREHDASVGKAGTDIMEANWHAGLNCAIMYKQICDAEGVTLQ